MLNKKKWMLIPVMMIALALTSCGGGDSSADTENFVRMMSSAETPSLTAVTTPAVTPELTLDWAEYTFPDLFPKNVGQHFPEIPYEGTLYNARVYDIGGGVIRYLGITGSGAIFGLGDFTNNALQQFNDMNFWSAQILADLCDFSPENCPGSNDGYADLTETNVTQWLSNLDSTVPFCSVSSAAAPAASMSQAVSSLNFDFIGLYQRISGTSASRNTIAPMQVEDDSFNLDVILGQLFSGEPIPGDCGGTMSILGDFGAEAMNLQATFNQFCFLDEDGSTSTINGAATVTISMSQTGDVLNGMSFNITQPLTLTSAEETIRLEGSASLTGAGTSDGTPTRNDPVIVRVDNFSITNVTTGNQADTLSNLLLYLWQEGADVAAMNIISGTYSSATDGLVDIRTSNPLRIDSLTGQVTGQVDILGSQGAQMSLIPTMTDSNLLFNIVIDGAPINTQMDCSISLVSDLL